MDTQSGYTETFAVNHFDTPAHSPSVFSTKQQRPKFSLASSAPGHLIQHRGVLYFRMRVPTQLRSCLGLTEIRKSLGTASLRDARPKAMRLASVALDIFKLAQEKERTMTDAQIRQAAKQWLAQALADEYEDRLQLRSRQHPDGLEKITDVYADVYAESMAAVELKGKYPAECVTLAKTVWKQIEKVEEVDINDVQFKKLCDALTLAKAALCESATVTPFTGQLAPQERWKVSAVKMIQQQWLKENEPSARFQTTTQPQEQQSLSTVTTKGVSLSEAVEVYIQAKGPTFAEGSKRNIFNNVRQFAQAVKDLKKGQDISITALDRQTMRDFARVLTAQPKNPKRKEYLGKSLVEIEALNVPADQRLSVKTLDTKFTMIKTLLNWCELEYGIQPRPLNSAMEIPKAQRKVENNRRAFTPEELKRLFNPASFIKETDDKPSNFWIPLIALFTGMRLEEIAQLHIGDIRQDEGVWCLDINELGNDGKHVKSEAGKRLVPIHPFLANDLGFLKFIKQVEASGEVRVFSELEREKKGNVGGAVTKWFTRYRRRVGVGEGQGEVSGVVFHSFRHTVVNHLLAALVTPRLVQKVVGHDATGAADIGITANYEGKYPTATLRDEVIMKLKWIDDAALLKTELLGLKKSRWAVSS